MLDRPINQLHNYQHFCYSVPFDLVTKRTILYKMTWPFCMYTRIVLGLSFKVWDLGGQAAQAHAALDSPD